MFYSIHNSTLIRSAAKIQLKEAWSFRIERKDELPASLDWYDPVPDQLAKRWRQIIQELPGI